MKFRKFDKKTKKKGKNLLNLNFDSNSARRHNEYDIFGAFDPPAPSLSVFSVFVRINCRKFVFFVVFGFAQHFGERRMATSAFDRGPDHLSNRNVFYGRLSPHSSFVHRRHLHWKIFQFVSNQRIRQFQYFASSYDVPPKSDGGYDPFVLFCCKFMVDSCHGLSLYANVQSRRMYSQRDDRRCTTTLGGTGL